MAIVVTDRVTISDDDYEVSFSRSGGAGGQNVNKVSSKVRLRFFLGRTTALTFGAKERLRALCPGQLTDDDELLITADSERDQGQNLRIAEQKLAALIKSILVPPKPRRPTKPSQGAKRRRLNDKAKRGDVKAGRSRVRADD